MFKSVHMALSMRDKGWIDIAGNWRSLPPPVYQPAEVERVKYK